MDDIELSNQAEILTKNPAFSKAMAGIREAFVCRLEECPIADHTLQHEVVLSLQILAGIERQLKSFITTGQLERKREEEKRKWYELRKSKVNSF